MSDEPKRFPLIKPEEWGEFQAFRKGMTAGIAIGLGLALLVAGLAWVLR